MQSGRTGIFGNASGPQPATTIEQRKKAPLGREGNVEAHRHRGRRHIGAGGRVGASSSSGPVRFRIFEAENRIGGNAVTADVPQDDGTAIPFDISVTACIPSIYRHILLLMASFGIDLVDTRFSYSVRYRGGIYAHDFDSDIRKQLQFETAPDRTTMKSRISCTTSNRGRTGPTGPVW